MSFTPNQDVLTECVNTLRANLHIQQDGAQVVFAALQKLRAMPDFLNYLAFIFSHDGAPEDVRQMAGIELKNSLKKKITSMPPAALAHLKAALLPSLASENRQLRNVACTALAVILGTGSLQAWPELTLSIVECLKTQTGGAALEGCLDLLLKLAEDYPGEMDAKLPTPDGTTASWSTLFVPHVIRISGLPGLSTTARNEALKLMYIVMNMMPDGYGNAEIEAMRDVLFQLALSGLPGIKVNVILALLKMLEFSSWALEASLLPLSKFMLQECQSTEIADEGPVSMYAAEWWSTFASAEMNPAVIRELLPEVVGVLMRNMIFDDLDDEVAQAEAEEKLGWAERAGGAVCTGGGGGGAEGDEDEEGDGYGDGEGAYTVRKASAQSLDHLTMQIGAEMLALVWPLVEARIASASWKERESAVLAIGAMAKGNPEMFLERGGVIVESLIAMLSADPNPLVRAITAWAVCQLSKALFLVVYRNRPGDAAAVTTLYAALDMILQRAMDANGYVRHSAIAALGAFCEEEEDVRVSHTTPGATATTSPILSGAKLGTVIQVLSEAAVKYPRRNLYALQQATSHLTQNAAAVLLQTPGLVRQLADPMIARLVSFPPTEEAVCTQLDMLGAVIKDVRHRIDYAAPTVFQMCLRVASTFLNAREGIHEGGIAFDFDEMFVVSAFDCIANMCEGLGASLEPLVAAHPALFQMVLNGCRPVDPDAGESPELQRTSFGLAGDLVRTCRASAAPHVPAILQAAVARIDPTTYSGMSANAYSNAMWCIGEVAGAYGGAPFEDTALLANIVTCSCMCLQYQSMIDSLTSANTAITLGKLCSAQPDKMALNLPNFLMLWCTALGRLPSKEDKKVSFEGLMTVLERNPGALGDLDRVRYFFQACSTYVPSKLPPALGQRMAAMLGHCKAQLKQAGQWEAAMRPMAGPAGDVPVLRKLVQMRLIDAAD